MRLSKRIFIVVLCFLSGCARSPERKPPPSVLPLVKVAQVKPRKLSTGVEATGTLKGAKEVRLAFNIPGKIRQFHVRDEQRVAEGEIIAELDCTSQNQAVRLARAAVESARANLNKVKAGVSQAEKRQQEQRVMQAWVNVEQAKRELQLQQKLRQQNLVPPKNAEDALFAVRKARAIYQEQEWMRKYMQSLPRPEDIEVALSQLRQAEEQLAKAKQDRENCFLRAPFSGRWVKINLEAGSFVQMGEPVGLLIGQGTLKVEAHLPEEKIGKVWEGQKVLISIEALGIKKEGKVALVQRVLEDRSRTFKVEIEMEKADPRLVPGLFVELLFVHQSKFVLSVPRKALLDRDMLFVLHEGKAYEKKIKPVIITENFVGVGDQLKDGELVIVAGQVGLRNGDRVKVVEKEE